MTFAGSQTPQEQSLKNSRPKAQYHDIVLNAEETAEALRLGREKKFYQLKTEERLRSVKAEIKPVKLTVEQLRDYITDKFPWFDQKLQKAQFDELLKYFTGDSEKGLILQGGVGSGKTTMMEVFQNNPKASYVKQSCRFFAELFARKENGGYEAIKPYYVNSFFMRNEFRQDERGLCFDDLGEETNKKHMGNEANVMESILLARYEKRELWKYTHITTNLQAPQIEEIYGKRLRSRIREMFIQIDFSDIDDLRK